MASISHRTLGADSSVMSSLANLFGRIFTLHDTHVTRKALARLSDRQLADLGLVRGDIDNIAGPGARR